MSCSVLTLLAHQVNARDDDDDYESSRLAPHVPNSPPPSFHSRSSSPRRHANQIQDPTLADAFGDDSDADSDDEVDDRQRLVRQNSSHQGDTTNVSEAAANAPSASSTAPPPHVYPGAAARSQRIVGGGGDGVFANMSARPERQGTSEKDEQPPVRNDALGIYFPGGREIY